MGLGLFTPSPVQEVPPEPLIFSPVRSAYAQEAQLTVQEQIGAELEESEPTSVACFCVKYLREVKGINIRGDAHTIQSNVDKPIMGGVVLFSYSSTDHASYIEAVLPNGNLWVSEANYESCAVTQRVIDKDDPFIRGYYYKNPNL